MWLQSLGFLRALLLALACIHCCSQGVVAMELFPLSGSGMGSGMDNETVLVLPPTSTEGLLPFPSPSTMAVLQVTISPVIRSSVGPFTFHPSSSPSTITISSTYISTPTLPTSVPATSPYSLRVTLSTSVPVPSELVQFSSSPSTTTEVMFPATDTVVTEAPMQTSIVASQTPVQAGTSTPISAVPTVSSPATVLGTSEPSAGVTTLVTLSSRPGISSMGSSPTPESSSVPASTLSLTSRFEEPTVTTTPAQLPSSTLSSRVQVLTSSLGAATPMPVTPTTTAAVQTTLVPSDSIPLSSSSPSISTAATGVNIVPSPTSSAASSSEAQRISAATTSIDVGMSTVLSPTESSTIDTRPTDDDETDTQGGGGFLKSFDDPTVLITVAVIGPVILLLLLVIIISICCCVCSKLRKTRRSRKLAIRASNPSIFANGKGPRFRRRQSNGSLQAYELNFIQVEDGPSQHGLSQAPPNDLEMGEFLYTGEASHSRSSQISPGAVVDPFHDPLPRLTPLSYPSQVVGGFHSRLSDEPEKLASPGAEAVPGSSSYSSFPRILPSLSVPTRMGLSLQHEESKSQSLQGSKVSIPGPSSRTQSYQGSRASILGSRISMPEPRSSSFSATTSRDDLKLSDRRNYSQDEDAISLQFSGRTMSPLLRSDNSMDENLPTRDSPTSAAAPLATSHMIGHGKKDFASLTCIPNHHAMEPAEELDLRLSPSPELDTHMERPALVSNPRSPSVEGSVTEGRRRSSGRVSLGELTTLPGQEPRAEAIPEQLADKEIKGGPKQNSKKQHTDSPTSEPKKPRSRTMSKLEKLTSLDYIRASLRLRKKKVSFEDNSVPKPTSKSKPRKPNLTFTNPTALESDTSVDSPQLPNPFLEKEPSERQFGPEYGDDPYSPALLTDDFDIGVPFQRHFTPRAQNHGDPYFQLSQPTYQMAQYQHAYPQLSQQFYPPQQPYPPYPPHGHPSHMGAMMGAGPYGRRYSDIPVHPPARYHGVVTPEGFPLDPMSPAHGGRYQDPGSPHSFLDTNPSVSDRMSATRSPDQFAGSTSLYDRFRPISPDRCTDTSDSRYTDAAEGYRDIQSPDRFTDSSIGSRYDTTPTRYGRMTTPERLVDVSYGRERYRERTPDHVLATHPPGRPSSGRSYDRLIDARRPSVLSNTSARSDKSAGKSRVSWNTEVIEYTLTPSDQSLPDYDVL